MIAKTDPPRRGRIALLTKKLDPVPSGGRELLCKLNHDALTAIFADTLVVFELSCTRVEGFFGLLNAFRGHIDGLQGETITGMVQRTKEDGVETVFVDGSNLGGFVAVLKRGSPQVEVVTFFHNVEARFFLGSFRSKKSFRALMVMVANYLAERKAVRYSDKRVCLSERDSRLLARYYGRGATHISPMAVEDKMPEAFRKQAALAPNSFALFVGGAFYANREGMTWFVRHVAPRIGSKICIVGRGFESLRSDLAIPGKVEVIGAVNNIEDWYRRAQFVIAPIFDGSGMKTKVAEALMFGKKLVGTPEAFSGYEGIAAQAGWVCRTDDEFVEAVSAASASITLGFDPSLRTLYEKNYSFAAAKARLQAIMVG
jgi:glycosyltransferase involved in cell wall biosynthesis